METYFIKTYGCQMNELDSSVMAGLLQSRGLKESFDESSADLIIFNTCSIRDLAERKVLGKIGILSRKKKKAIIGIAGCMSMLKKEKLLEKFPFIDFVLGTNNILDLNDVIDSVLIKKKKLCLTDNKSFEISPLIAKHPSNIKAYVSIIRGCNNFCSYCIVPYTRGRETSRNPKHIIDECIHLRDLGYKEITLLGQNVNSYGNDSKIEKKTQFHDLLYEIDKIDGIERIRFLTSHPKDITKNLMHAIKDLPSVCEFLHLPMQSGSTKILKAMNRRYTKEDYLEKVSYLKEIVPNITIGTDIIVGFPGETDEDFEDTIDTFNKVRFNTAFIFAFSPRKGTPAATLPNIVPAKIKKDRMQKLLSLYNKILKEDSLKYVDTTQEVLVERFNKDNKMLKGKTRGFQKVIFKGSNDMLGSLKKIKLTKFNHHTFLGQLI